VFSQLPAFDDPQNIQGKQNHIERENQILFHKMGVKGAEIQWQAKNHYPK
jgi:hypothetical protein